MKFLISLSGTELTPDEIQLLSQKRVGGVVLFGRNILSQETTSRLINDIKSLNHSLLVCIDEEGGLVSRIQHFFPNYSQPYCGLISSPEVRDYYRKRSEILKGLGVDINLAPVVDIATQEKSIMYKRAFGSSVEKVVELSRICIEEQRRVGILSCIKHFPGHGRVSTDSHEETPFIEGDFSSWDGIEGKIFRDLISSGVDCVMVGHLVFRDIDKDVATYSSFWVNTVLRKQFGFAGKVISDDLSMRGLPELGVNELNEKLDEVKFDLVIVTDKNHFILKNVVKRS